MNLLITGADGFIGRNLRASLRQSGHQLFPVDLHTSRQALASAAENADFVFHLAGINRPDHDSEFQAGNVDYTEALLEMLAQGKCPPVLFASSTQAELDNPYGKSKLAAEQALAQYNKQTNAPVYLYRLTNVFGKWSKPNYNSAVATFCYNIARGMAITVTDPRRTLCLLYIDDVIAEFMRALDGHPTDKSGNFCTAGPTHEVTLQRLVDLLQSFQQSRTTLDLPDQRDDFIRKLYATYQSFMPPEQLSYTPRTHADSRGAFAELLHMGAYGQVSVNVTKPGVAKGFHWHHTKHEKFIVVAGQGMIRLRDSYGGPVYTYPVDGNTFTVVDIPPGYVHTIENTAVTNLVTVMWASEIFDPARPDTFAQELTEPPNGDDLQSAN